MLSAVIRRTFSIVGLLVLATAMLLPFSQSAKAYSCGTGTSGHCYALAESYLGAIINGGAVSIMTTHLSAGSGSSGWFIDNEEWVMQTSGCSSSYGQSWVEVGEETVQSSAQRYFWADVRPVDCTFFKQYFANVPSGDYGYYTYFQIYRKDSTDWTITVSSQTGYWSGTSTNNSMHPDDINQGMELAGQSGASAPATQYTNRYYKDTTNTWYSIDNDYATLLDNPPNLHVNNSPEYYDFYTTCCTVGGIASAPPQGTGVPSQSFDGTPSPPIGAHILKAGNMGVTREQVIQYAKTFGITRATAIKPITVDSAQLLTSAQIANELHGEQTGFASDHIFWFLRVSGQFSAEFNHQTRVYSHGVIVIDPATGNLVMDGGLQN
jgi:hypothetical protein